MYTAMQLRLQMDGYVALKRPETSEACDHVRDRQMSNCSRQTPLRSVQGAQFNQKLAEG